MSNEFNPQLLCKRFILFSLIFSYSLYHLSSLLQSSLCPLTELTICQALCNYLLDKYVRDKTGQTSYLFCLCAHPVQHNGSQWAMNKQEAQAESSVCIWILHFPCVWVFWGCIFIFYFLCFSENICVWNKITFHVVWIQLYSFFLKLHRNSIRVGPLYIFYSLVEVGCKPREIFPGVPTATDPGSVSPSFPCLLDLCAQK